VQARLPVLRPLDPRFEFAGGARGVEFVLVEQLQDVHVDLVREPRVGVVAPVRLVGGDPHVRDDRNGEPALSLGNDRTGPFEESDAVRRRESAQQVADLAPIIIGVKDESLWFHDPKVRKTCGTYFRRSLVSLYSRFPSRRGRCV